MPAPRILLSNVTAAYAPRLQVWSRSPTQWRGLRRSSSSTLISRIRQELIRRELPILRDVPVPTPSRILEETLSDFFPQGYLRRSSASSPEERGGESAMMTVMRPGHHLVYFPPVTAPSSLLSDGTDPIQSPGDPFARRMWAGGRVRFFAASSSTRRPQLRTVGEPAVCLERIVDVAAKGKEGEEKVFVTTERRISGSVERKVEAKILRSHGDDGNGKSNSSNNGGGVERRTEFHDHIARMTDEQAIRRAGLAATDDSESVPWALVEERHLVFMRERSTLEQVAAGAAAAARERKTVRPRASLLPPTFSHTLRPTFDLLFRFSALTLNAHKIHLDRAFCRDLEGHRDLLVHGPLSLVLMLEMLQDHLAATAAAAVAVPEKEEKEEEKRRRRERVIDEIEYRNVAPLYAGEDMTVCGRDRGDGVFDVWVQGPEGGVAVKGVAKVVERR